MNKLRSIAIEERRQLITFGFAVIVFLMTLVALQFSDRGATLSRVATINHQGTNQASVQAIAPSRQSPQDSPVRSRNRALALAAATSMASR